MQKEKDTAKRMAVLVDRARGIYRWIDGRSGGGLGVLAQSISRFAEMGGGLIAASLAYYALFALFPLTLFLVAIVGSVLESDVAYYQTLNFIRSIFPFSGDVVEKNLAEVIQRRGTVGALGILGLLWSASGFFHTLALGVNRAWPKVKLRSFVQSRLVALGMIGALIVLFLLSLITSTVTGLMPAVLNLIGIDTWILRSSVWRLVLRVVPALFTFLLFTALYRWVPNKTVRWKAVLTGALIITLAWEAGKSVFGLYLASGLARYEFIYGSLGTLIALMVWIYVTSMLTLFGAYLVASLDMRAEQLQGVHHRESKSDRNSRSGADREPPLSDRDRHRLDREPDRPMEDWKTKKPEYAGPNGKPAKVPATTSGGPPAANKGLRG